MDTLIVAMRGVRPLLASLHRLSLESAAPLANLGEASRLLNQATRTGLPRAEDRSGLLPVLSGVGIVAEGVDAGGAGELPDHLLDEVLLIGMFFLSPDPIIE